MNGFTSVLKRDGFDAAIGVDNGLLDLGRKAMELFGYRRLALDEAKKTMMATLSKYQLMPFNAFTVRIYENNMLSLANDKLWQSQAIKITRFLAVSLIILFSGPLVLGGFITSPIAILGFGEVTAMRLVFYSLMIMFVSAVVWVVSQAVEKIKSTAVWREIPVNQYEGQIPTNALEAATELKEKLPEVKITVYILEQEVEVLDPFLVATLGGQKYYFAVWDEKDFYA